MCTTPSFVSVAASATMSGMGVPAAVSNKVLRPDVLGADAVLAQSKANMTSVGAKGAVGVKANTKLWAAPAGISTGVSGVPVI
jgi:hypothetical protein